MPMTQIGNNKISIMIMDKNRTRTTIKMNKIQLKTVNRISKNTIKTMTKTTNIRATMMNKGIG